MNIVFISNFYAKYQAPNAKELIEVINGYDESDIDNSKFGWGDLCSSNKIPLEASDIISLLEPNFDLFAEELDLKFHYNIDDPWINLYKRGDHQELHGHYPSHMSCVFFANSGEGFSKFYFKDRNNTNLHPKIGDLVGYIDEHMIEYKEGDILFFPSHMLHGVSPHNSSVVRKTLSFNFDIKRARDL